MHPVLYLLGQRMIKQVEVYDIPIQYEMYGRPRLGLYPTVSVKRECIVRFGRL